MVPDCTHNTDSRQCLVDPSRVSYDVKSHMSYGVRSHIKVSYGVPFVSSTICFLIFT